MSCETDLHTHENLRRWQESGEPLAWVESRGGHWNQRDWLTLLGNLRHSEFWPLPAAEVGALLEGLSRERDNLHRLSRLGLVRGWVEARAGKWGEADWDGLLADLRDAGFWPLQTDAVRRMLEGLTREWHNLRQWEHSGQPRAWIEAHEGVWSHHEWLALTGALQCSEFWPLDLAAAGEVLERLKILYWNLRRWQESGWPRRWVAARRGQWGPDDWLALLEALQRSPYWPLDVEAVRRILEETRIRLLNLHRWERSGQPRTWVAQRWGEWEHGEWLALLDDLQQSPYWPLDLDAIGTVLEEVRADWRNLRRWQESEDLQSWLQTRHGRWGESDWLQLLDNLRHSAFWPLDPAAARQTLERATAEWLNLRNWRASGQPQLWIEAHGGEWGHADWLALLESLRPSQFWPLNPRAVGRVLDEAKVRYANLRRWQESGAAAAWVAACGGEWGRGEWLGLLRALRRSSFWPLDAAAVAGLLEQGQGRRENSAGEQQESPDARALANTGGESGLTVRQAA